jgi:hypothetical protein
MKKIAFMTFLFMTSAPLCAFEADIVTIEVTCPIDNNKFTMQKIRDSQHFAVMLDGQDYGVLASPEPAAKCPNDGFIVYKNNFTAQELNILKNYITTDEYKNLLKNDTDYRIISKMQEKVSAPPQQILSSIRRATWEAYNKLNGEKYLEYANTAIEFIDKLKVPSEEDIFFKGELFRRSGKFDEASKIFNDLKKRAAGSMLKKVNQQLHLIEAGITATVRTEL